MSKRTAEEWAKRLTLQDPPPAIVVGTIRAAMTQAEAKGRRQALEDVETLIHGNWPEDGKEELRLSGDKCITLAMNELVEDVRALLAKEPKP